MSYVAFPKFINYNKFHSSARNKRNLKLSIGAKLNFVLHFTFLPRDGAVDAVLLMHNR